MIGNSVHLQSLAGRSSGLRETQTDDMERSLVSLQIIAFEPNLSQSRHSNHRLQTAAPLDSGAVETLSSHSVRVCGCTVLLTPDNHPETFNRPLLAD